MNDPEPVGDEAREFEGLLDYLRRCRGFDFTGYKRASLMRRVEKRMGVVGVAGFGNYIDYLEVHPDEFGLLFDTILINVTAFFRDPSSWEAVADQVIPRVVAARHDDEPIRLWSAGCASGEEAFTLAILMAEAIGVDRFRERVKIYATDVDEEALTRARQASYDEREIEPVPEALREKYFERAGNRHVFRKDLRRSLIFGRHDLLQDAPISRIDLLACRNTLMYFNTETQARVLDRFHFGLHDQGFLFLGKAETLLTYNNTFVPIDLKRRVFIKVSSGPYRDRLHASAKAGGEEAVNQPPDHARVREAAFDASPVAQVVVDAAGALAQANGRARALFGLAHSDVGSPLRDLQLSYRPTDLRTSIDLAHAERRAVVIPEVEWPSGDGGPGFLEIHVSPLQGPGGALLGVGITFIDITATKALRDALETSHRELETAYEVLQSTNEELETTNEELQSTVEELETTNEELETTNEEAETMNEELQSTNEELETLNTELRERSIELNRVNTYMHSILASLRDAVVVVDPDFLVQVWNERAEDMWGLRADEVGGKNLLNLDFGLSVHRLKSTLRACVSHGARHQEVALEALNRRGRSFPCRITCTPMAGPDGASGVILMMEDETDRVPAPNGDAAAVPEYPAVGNPEGAERS